MVRLSSESAAAAAAVAVATTVTLGAAVSSAILNGSTQIRDPKRIHSDPRFLRDPDGFPQILDRSHDRWRLQMAATDGGYGWPLRMAVMDGRYGWPLRMVDGRYRWWLRMTMHATHTIHITQSHYKDTPRTTHIIQIIHAQSIEYSILLISLLLY